MSHRDITCFKAYDIRGQVPETLDADIAYRIGRALVQELNAKTVAVGWDIRDSSPMLVEALSRGIQEQGADVKLLGEGGTEEVYFATWHWQLDAGVMITASHNPKGWNGMKLVREQSKPISGDTGLHAIQALAESGAFTSQTKSGSQGELAGHRDAYIRHLVSLTGAAANAPLKIVANPGNGGAGHVIDAIQAALGDTSPFNFIKVHFEPDGTFPNGVPNPLLPENRAATSLAIQESGADFGIAWDGDFDRCFLFDERGQFIEGYYIVGLLAEAFLRDHPGSKIVHDPRLTWNTVEMVEAAGGVPIESKTGHAFIKERMRSEDAGYGGEMSAHHYFRDFAYCDSGMLPWLYVAKLLSDSGKSLSELVAQRMEAFPCSGEINRVIAHPQAALLAIENAYAPSANRTQHIDGLSLEYDDWRFNLRMSNTEPVVRLNVESRGDSGLMKSKTRELLAKLDAID